MNKSFNINYLLITSICLLLTSCDFSKRIDTTAAVKELHEREVKRITPAQFTAQVDEWGKVIVDSLNKNFGKNLENNVLIDSLSNKYRVEISLGSPLKLKNPALGEKINQILDAYQYNAERHLEQIDNIQKSDDEKFFYYTAPILFKNQFEGLKKAKIEELGKIGKLDSLTSRKKGDFIGLWMIKFSKKEVVRLADPKHLKSLSEK
ncbi:hypothetical protein LV89_00571 [Arcicella aurantiaca]|uniref:Lipoprotein n=1 Tax=Arcicella aurantiaca TaxID=591202 RepID=A0A316EEM0_9BACT|nr:hypothetical protein [Arcicella aurantiaca]PWK29017.1 hypothetical protein LV89_00571 [Arcicella aurantiaca]